MSIYAEIIDLDELYRNAPRQPLDINGFNINSEADKEEINRLIMTQYGSDFLELEPSCDCGMLKGGYNEGIVCPHCSTEVIAVTEQPLETAVWLGLPKGVKAFINPKVYAILSKHMTISKFNILEHLVNPTARGPETKNAAVRKYMRLEIPRGINHFYDNFEEIIDLLVTNNVFQKDAEDKQGGQGKVNSLITFLKVFREVIFCQHLPLPTKLMLITESTVTTTFASSHVFLALDAVRTICDAENAPVQLSPRSLQSRAMKANDLMAQYNEQSFKDFFSSKEGWWRQHIYGSRSHFTFRAVINSMTDPHAYNELHIPWALAVMVFRIHLVSKLVHRGWSLRRAQTLLDEHTQRYHKTLDDLFKELIDEAPAHRIPVLFNRNPSLLRGSIQLLYITKVKPDVEVRSISISVLILKTLNADFDGDRFCLPLIVRSMTTTLLIVGDVLRAFLTKRYWETVAWPA